MINDEMKDKLRIMERLHNAEIRNLERENTIKNLTTHVENDNSKLHVNNNTTKQSNNDTDDIVLGMRNRVTKFVLNRIDSELNKLEDEFTQKNVNTEFKYVPSSTPSSLHYNPHNNPYDWSYQNNYNQWEYGYTNYQSHETDYSGQTNICTDNLIQIDLQKTFDNAYSLPTSVYPGHSRTASDVSKRTTVKTQPTMTKKNPPRMCKILTVELVRIRRKVYHFSTKQM